MGPQIIPLPHHKPQQYINQTSPPRDALPWQSSRSPVSPDSRAIVVAPPPHGLPAPRRWWAGGQPPAPRIEAVSIPSTGKRLGGLGEAEDLADEGRNAGGRDGVLGCLVGGGRGAAEVGEDFVYAALLAVGRCCASLAGGVMAGARRETRVEAGLAAGSRVGRTGSRRARADGRGRRGLRLAEVLKVSLLGHTPSGMSRLRRCGSGDGMRICSSESSRQLRSYLVQ